MKKRVLTKTFEEMVAEKSLLTEGLIVSYGSNCLKRLLIKEFKNFILQIEDIPIFPKKSSKYGNPCTVTIQINSQSELDERLLQQILDKCGYFVVRKEDDIFQFEPKYPVKIDSSALDGYRLFHVTEEDRTDKILKFGLQPKISRTFFNHPSNGIYLFATKNPSKCLPALKNSLKEKRKVSTEMVALEIGKGSIQTDELYYDESFPCVQNLFYAIFTLRSIPNYAVKVLEEFEL